MISTQSVGAMMLRQPTENNQRRVSKEALCAARARSAVGPANYGTLDLRAAPDPIEVIRLFNQRLSGSWVEALVVAVPSDRALDDRIVNLAQPGAQTRRVAVDLQITRAYS